MSIFRRHLTTEPGVAESPEAVAAADSLLKGVGASSPVSEATPTHKLPEATTFIVKTEPQAEGTEGECGEVIKDALEPSDAEAKEARYKAQLAKPADPEDPYQGPLTPLQPKVGRLSSRKPNVPADNVTYTQSLARATTDMLETIHHLAVQATRLVKLQQPGEPPFQPNSHVIAILTQMEQMIWTHSTSHGLLNNVQRLTAETYAEIQRARRDQAATLKGVDITAL